MGDGVFPLDQNVTQFVEKAILQFPFNVSSGVKNEKKAEKFISFCEEYLSERGLQDTYQKPLGLDDARAFFYDVSGIREQVLSNNDGTWSEYLGECNVKTKANQVILKLIDDVEMPAPLPLPNPKAVGGACLRKRPRPDETEDGPASRTRQTFGATASAASAQGTACAASAETSKEGSSDPDSDLDLDALSDLIELCTSSQERKSGKYPLEVPNASGDEVMRDLYDHAAVARRTELLTGIKAALDSKDRVKPSVFNPYLHEVVSKCPKKATKSADFLMWKTIDDELFWNLWTRHCESKSGDPQQFLVRHLFNVFGCAKERGKPKLKEVYGLYKSWWEASPNWGRLGPRLPKAQNKAMEEFMHTQDYLDFVERFKEPITLRQLQSAISRMIPKSD